MVRTWVREMKKNIEKAEEEGYRELYKIGK